MRDNEYIRKLHVSSIEQQSSSTQGRISSVPITDSDSDSDLLVIVFCTEPPTHRSVTVMRVLVRRCPVFWATSRSMGCRTKRTMSADDEARKNDRSTRPDSRGGIVGTVKSFVQSAQANDGSFKGEATSEKTDNSDASESSRTESVVSFAKRLVGDVETKTRNTLSKVETFAIEKTDDIEKQARSNIERIENSARQNANEADRMARNRANKVETLARENLQRVTTTARSRMSEVDSFARNTVKEVETQTRRKVERLEILARQGATEADQIARGRMNEVEGLARKRLIDLQATARNSANGVDAIARSAVEDASKKAIMQKQAAEKEIEGFVEALTSMPVKTLSRSREVAVQKLEKLRTKLGIEEAEAFVNEHFAIVDMLDEEVKRVRNTLYGDHDTSDTMQHKSNVDPLKVASLFVKHSRERQERWDGWLQSNHIAMNPELGAKFAEYIDIACAIYEKDASDEIEVRDSKRKRSVRWKNFKSALLDIDVVSAFDAIRPPSTWRVIKSRTNAQPGRPAFALLVEESGENRVVVAIRGTASIADVLTDTLGASIPFGFDDSERTSETKNEAHAGFVHSARKILEDISRELEEYVFLQQRPLVITGHSLGAATSAALTVAILSKYPGKFSPPQSQMTECSLECFAFACPPVFTIDLAEGISEYITAIVNSDDCVPCGSLHTLVNLLNEIGRQDKVAYSADLTERVLLTAELSGGDSAKWLVRQLRKQIEGADNVFDTLSSGEVEQVTWPTPKSPQLLPPGRIIHLVRTDSPPRVSFLHPSLDQDSSSSTTASTPTYTAVVAPNTRFTEIKIVADMLTDHPSDAYRAVISRTFKPL